MQKLVCCMFALTLLISGCSKEQSQAPTSAPPPEVGVTTLAYENLNSVTRYPGRTKVLQQIDLVPEVAGIIIAQHFQEGQKVKRGETLYELDPEPLEAEVQQQTHRLAQAQSAVKVAELRYDMSQSLARSNALSKLDLEQVKMDWESAKAAEAGAKAALLKAQIKLKRSKITSPMDATVGLAIGKVGDLAGPSYGPVTSLTVDTSIEVYTQIDEQEHTSHVMEVKQNPEILPDTLKLELSDGSVYPLPGKINYIGSQISPSSGTITYRVIFDNPDGILLGGQDVTILATSQRAQEILRIPQSAVQEDQMGRFVYVVDEAEVASKRYLNLAERIADTWVVEEGLESGDRVVVSGILRVKAGQPVSPLSE